MEPSDQGTFTPVGAQGSMEPPWENHFPTGILQWNLHHICTGNKKTQFCKKKKKKKKKLQRCTVSKWRPNNRFLFRVISILAKLWKTTFSKEFFNKIWLKEGEYEYIYITEITFSKKLFHFKMVAKTIFWYCAIMLVYAN